MGNMVLLELLPAITGDHMQHKGSVYDDKEISQAMKYSMLISYMEMGW